MVGLGRGDLAATASASYSQLRPALDPLPAVHEPCGDAVASLPFKPYDPFLSSFISLLLLPRIVKEGEECILPALVVCAALLYVMALGLCWVFANPISFLDFEFKLTTPCSKRFIGEDLQPLASSPWCEPWLVGLKWILIMAVRQATKRLDCFCTSTHHTRKHLTNDRAPSTAFIGLRKQTSQIALNNDASARLVAPRSAPHR